MSTQVNWTKQAALAAALFALGLGAYWLEYKRKPEKETSEEQARRVFALPKDAQVRSIRLADPYRPVELVCADIDKKLCKPGDNSKWQVAEPVKTRADDTNANSLLSAISNLNAIETIDLTEETPQKRAAILKEYGLSSDLRSATAIRKLKLQTTSGEIVGYLGLTHPIGDGIFTIVEKDGKPDENRVFLVPNYFKSNFEKDATYWRDKKLFSLAANEIGSFELQGPKARVRGVRKDGHWTLTTLDGKKEEFAGDIENIDSLLSGALFLAARDFASESKSDAKAKAALRGAQSALTLTLSKEAQPAEAVTLKLLTKGKPPGQKVFATVSNLDPLFELDPSSKDRLDKSLKDLRLAKLITSLERFTAKRLEFSGKPVGTQPLVLVNADNRWMKADKTEISPDRVQTTLDKLSGNRIKDFLSGPAIPPGEKEGLIVTLGDEKSAEKRKLLFWKSGSRLLAKDLLSNRNEAFVVDTTVNDGLPWDPEFYTKK